MKKIGYIIFKYEEGEFTAPEFFTDKEKAYKRYDELAEKLREDLDGEVDEWDEINGKGITLMCQDTIYRIASVEYSEGCRKLYLYCDMENNKCFQIGHYMESEDMNKAEMEYLSKCAAYQKDAECDCENNFKNSLHSNNNDTFKSTHYWTENGRYGDAYFGCMTCSLSVG